MLAKSPASIATCCTLMIAYATNKQKVLCWLPYACFLVKWKWAFKVHGADSKNEWLNVAEEKKYIKTLLWCGIQC